MTARLSLAAARRIALAAQGLDRPRPQRPVTMRDVQRTIDRLALLQIDSVNVLARAHLMPLFSRLGAYDLALLERAYARAPRRLFEYWGHAASLIDVTLEPALRFRMAQARQEAWGRLRTLAAEQPGLLDQMRAAVAAGPGTAREIDARLGAAAERRRDHWGWNWSDTKTALEFLFWAGEITSATRNQHFERVFDLPENVLPPHITSAPTPSPQEAHLTLVRRAAAALGIATTAHLADYFRLRVAPTRAAIATLVASGELSVVTVAGWASPAYLWHQARRPRAVAAGALVSPFDSLVFERGRVKDLFGVDYRIEIYVPAAQRRFGYYVYLFVLGEAIVARVDLKADRAAGALRVVSAHLEPGADPSTTAAALAAELRTLAGWLGLDTLSVAPMGDLAAPLAAQVDLHPLG